MRRTDLFRWIAAAGALVAGCFWGATAAMEQAASVQQMAERYNLLGTYAWDCARPPANDNWYFVSRVIDAGHVQRDRMVGPSTRGRVFMIDKIEALGPNDVAIGSFSDGERVESIWKVGPNVVLLWRSTRNGKPTLIDGKDVGSGKVLLPLKKCNTPGQQAQAPSGNVVAGAPPAVAGSAKAVFEKYNLLGSFAMDCTKPPSDGNPYYFHRALDDGRIQRDYMTGPTTRQWVSIIERVEELRPNEIRGVSRVTGRIGGQNVDNAPGEGVWRIEGNSIKQWSAQVGGRTLIVNGQVNGRDWPATTRCSS